MYRFVNHPSMICDIKARELFTRFNAVICKTLKLHVPLMLRTERSFTFNCHFIQRVYSSWFETTSKTLNFSRLINGKTSTKIR